MIRIEVLLSIEEKSSTGFGFDEDGDMVPGDYDVWKIGHERFELIELTQL